MNQANPLELEKIIKRQLIRSISTSEQPNEHHPMNRNDFEEINSKIDLLFDRCNSKLKDETDKLKQLNCILTMYVSLIVRMKQNKKLRSNPAITKTNHNLISKEQLEQMNLNSMNLIDAFCVEKREDYDMINLILKLLICLICKDDELNDNDQIDLLISDRLFDQLIRILCRSRKEMNEFILLIFNLMGNFNGNNLFKMRLSLLENEIALNVFAQVISKKFYDFNQLFRHHFCDQQTNQNGTLETIFSALTGLILSTKTTTTNQPLNFDSNLKFEQILEQLDHRSILLSFYDLIHLNRNFIQFLLVNHSNDQQTTETNNLLINFLEYCSIVIFCLREYFQKNELLQKKLINTIRICFIILTSIIEDQFANSMMHDKNNGLINCRIHRSKLRHRTNQNLEESTKQNRPIAYSILDLMIEFLFSNLRLKQFPIDLYVFSNNIILKHLCYLIKFEIRNDYQWSDLWHSLFCLLRFLTVNYDKLDVLKIKRRNRMLLLANNIVNLFNLFIIFGDTFLYTPSDYDNLYYELLRNHDLFNNLIKLVRHHSQSKNRDEKEAALKVLDSIDNIESIINHFIGKLNEINKTDCPLTKDEISDLLRNNYDTLNIKIKDGLDIYENYQQDKLLFKKKLLKKIIEHTRNVHLFNLDELISNQQTIMNSILLDQ